VYQIECTGCHAVYIGQTKRQHPPKPSGKIQHSQTCSPEDQGQPRPHHISRPTNPDQRSSKTE
jgi:hypothetical protein